MKDTIRRYIQATMDAVDIHLDVKQDKSGINMSYNFIENHLGFDPDRIQQALKELQIPISLELYIKIFTLHELGHSLDRDSLLDSIPRTIEIFKMKKTHLHHEQYTNRDLLAMLIEEHEMNIAFEEKAWENAEQLNKQYRLVNWTIFEKVKSHSLSTYTLLYEEDLSIFEQLVGQHNEQTA